MAIDDLPRMAASSYATTAHNLDSLVGGNNLGIGGWSPTQSSGDDGFNAMLRRADMGQKVFHRPTMEIVQVAQQARRVVKVIIADTNENVPLEDCVLYSGEEKLTDLTDQELFFELDIKGLLEKHNAKRVKLVDKKVKDRTEHLEPAKVRDLKMVVVNVAQF